MGTSTAIKAAESLGLGGVTDRLVNIAQTASRLHWAISQADRALRHATGPTQRASAAGELIHAKKQGQQWLQLFTADAGEAI